MGKTNNSEIGVLLKLTPTQYRWLENRAAKNNRARLREAVEIIEAERIRERTLRRSACGILSAQGDIRTMEINAAKRLRGAK